MKKSFNSEQLKVINELNNNILLIASAGTGKTDTLTSRIQNIIKENKAKPREILCITFTNKACREMEERIEEALGKDAKYITIKTFHSFCLQIIKENAKRSTDIFTDFIVLDEDDSKEVIKIINKKNYNLGILYNFISKVKEYRIKLNYLTENANEDYKNVIIELFSNYEDEINDLCKEKINNRFQINYELKKVLKDFGHILVNKYNLELKKGHMLDFSDLIIEAKKLFDNYDIVSNYASRYKYINIDEVQDTSIVEYKIIEKIFSKNNVLLCGDKFQTIYEWRGSHPNEIQNEYMKFNPVTIKFNKNYRATKVLTEASLSFLENTFSKEYKDLYNEPINAFSSELGEKITYHVSSSRKDEANWINKTINNLYFMGKNPGKICILTRDNRLNIELSNYLKSNNTNANFEFVLVDEYKFFRRQEIKDVVSFLKLIINPNDSISLKRIIKRFPTGIGETTIKNIESDKYKNIGIKLSDYIYPKLYGEYFSQLVDDFYSNTPMVIFDVESTGVDVTEDEIIQIAAIKINNKGEIIDTFERFIKPSKSVGKSYNVHGFSDEFLSKNGENKYEVFKEFIAFSKDLLIIGHNVQYDISILSSEFERLNIKRPEFKGVYDTLDIYRRFYPNLPNHKLETLSNLFPVNHKPSHNALDDVKATAYLLIYAINEKIKNTTMERMALMGDDISKFKNISKDLYDLGNISKNMRPYEIVEYVVNNFNFNNIYPKEEREDKFKRIEGFRDFLRKYDKDEKNNRDALIDIINLTALSNGELEELMLERDGKVKIPIITVHQAKGLEYNTVFIAGLEEGKFPSYRSVRSGNICEEQRLFYVAITRAKERLFLSHTSISANGRYEDPSEFIENIPQKYILIK